MKKKETMTMRSVLAVGMILSLSACSSEVTLFGKPLGAWVSFLQGAPDSKPVLNAADLLQQQNAQLLSEMFHVVLLRDPVGQGEFDQWLNPLMQGASLEGVYNGFVHSTQYQKIEQRPPAADHVTLETFLMEMSELVPSLDKTQLEKDYRQASLFTLKRVLGDQALARVAGLSAKPADLADWYSKWAARLATSGVDFGLALRSKPDAAFHRAWAMEALQQGKADRLNWEILNRLHRVLNATEKRAMQNVAGGGPAPAADESASDSDGVKRIDFHGSKGR